MRSVTTVFVGAVLAVFSTSTGAVAQSYYDDQACRQYADAQVAPLRNQAGAQAGAETFGSALLGAGVGAAIGGAVGGGRGAGIGAASGAVVGGSAGAVLRAVYGLPKTPTAALWRAAGGLWARPGLRLPALVL